MEGTRDAQDSWILGLGTPKVLGFLRFWVWVLGFKFWVLGGYFALGKMEFRRKIFKN